MNREIEWDEHKARLLNCLLGDQRYEAKEFAQNILNSGTSPSDFFENCITPVLVEIGKRFETLDIFLPEMVIASEIVKEINQEVIQPVIKAQGAQNLASAGKVLMATVEGDLHDIGKNIVCAMLDVSGFEVIDMGVNVSAHDLVDRAEQLQVEIIGLSSLLTSCLPYMKDVLDLLNIRGIRDHYFVMIGGAAPTESFVIEIGANAQGHTAAEALRLCKEYKQKVTA
jgi:methylmalonyl-CoA mutase cobalamin-binding domain/chain